MVNCTSEWISSNHVLATCRTALRQQGVLGLNMAPCMRAFLERLPVMLQEQYAYEKVPALLPSPASCGVTPHSSAACSLSPQSPQGFPTFYLKCLSLFSKLVVS